MAARTLILGLGNPIMCDDRIGLYVTQTMLHRLPGTHDIVGKERIRLEEILRFDRLIVIDSYTDKDTDAGRIRKSAPIDFMDTIHRETRRPKFLHRLTIL